MNPLVKKYGHEARWVTWKLQERKGKTTKIPFDLFGDMASSIDPKTWSTYDEVKNFSDNVGIMFGPSQTLLGIDIDKVLVDGKPPKEIKDFIILANTYTEVSPSGTGLHLFFELTEPLELTASKHAPFEIYNKGRYFTVTEKIAGRPRDVRTVTPKEALEILASIGYPWGKSDHIPDAGKMVDNEVVNKKKEMTTDEQLALPPVQKTAKVNTPSITMPAGKLSDSEVLKKMFASNKGKKIKEIYDHDPKDKDADLSALDLSLCSYLAFWTQKDQTQIERLWMGAPIGNRKKTQERADYRKLTIDAAIASCKDVYQTPTMKLQKQSAELDLDLLFTLNYEKEIVFTQNTENMCRILRKHPQFQGRFRYDKFRNVLEILENGKWRMIEDNDEVAIQTEISVLFSYFGKVGKEMVKDAMVKVARECAIDSALDYVNSLHWDGVPRLDTWLRSVYGCPDDEYHRAVGSNWLKGLVKRIVEPGCKFDYVLVLEGPQGSKKSTSLSVLGKGWYVETTMSTDTKDFFMQFTGNLIIEFSEGETLNRTEVKRMKAIITTQTDKYRPAYGRNIMEFPRRCVFAMTTNDEEYLKDDTGNRRWLPVKLMNEEANIAWLEANRDQLYAEANHRVTILKETVYEFPKDKVTEMQNMRKVHYEHEDLIISWYYNKLKDFEKAQGITVHQVYRDALNGGFNNKMLNKGDEMKIAQVIKNVLGLTRVQVMINKHRSYKWVDPEIKFDPNLVAVTSDEDEY